LIPFPSSSPPRKTASFPYPQTVGLGSQPIDPPPQRTTIPRSMRHFLRHTMTFSLAHTYGRRRLWHTHCAAFFYRTLHPLSAYHLPVNYCEVSTACSIGIEHRECCSTVSEPEPAHLLVCTVRAPPILSRRPFALLRLARAHRLPSQSPSTSLIPADARVCKATTTHESLSTPIPPGCSPPLPRCMGSRQARSSQITCTL
jgi:hypothetical protein